MDPRLVRAIRRAEAGSEMVIGFLGGSITQGSLATEDRFTYARRVWQWWADTFPRSVFHFVNAGIGATTSHFAAARAREDLTMYRPDVVFVDFSVNDSGNGFYQETFEGTVRALLSAPSAPAVVILHNAFYDTGVTAEPTHSAVARRYGLAEVSVRDTLYAAVRDGRYALHDVSPDGLHPNDFGHGLLAAEIVRVLEEARSADAPAAAEEPLPAPLTANAYEHARRLNIRNADPELDGFRADPAEKKGMLDIFRNGWVGRHAGDRLFLAVDDVSCIAVQYKKTVRGTAPVADLVLDGDAAHPIRLDGTFEERWGDCLFLQPILHHGARGRHTLDVTVREVGDAAIPLEIVSFIVA